MNPFILTLEYELCAFYDLSYIFIFGIIFIENYQKHGKNCIHWRKWGMMPLYKQQVGDLYLYVLDRTTAVKNVKAVDMHVDI